MSLWSVFTSDFEETILYESCVRESRLGVSPHLAHILRRAVSDNPVYTLNFHRGSNEERKERWPDKEPRIITHRRVGRDTDKSGDSGSDVEEHRPLTEVRGAEKSQYIRVRYVADIRPRGSDRGIERSWARFRCALGRGLNREGYK